MRHHSGKRGEDKHFWLWLFWPLQPGCYSSWWLCSLVGLGMGYRYCLLQHLPLNVYVLGRGTHVCTYVGICTHRGVRIWCPVPSSLSWLDLLGHDLLMYPELHDAAQSSWPASPVPLPLPPPKHRGYRRATMPPCLLMWPLRTRSPVLMFAWQVLSLPRPRLPITAVLETALV